VDVGEVDVVLIATGQVARLQVDAFKGKKFNGTVSEVANSAKGLGQSALSMSSSSQDATKFEVHIRIKEKELFLPGMSVTADIETRYRTNVLTVPIASLTTRLPKEPDKKGSKKNPPATNALAKASGTNSSLDPDKKGSKKNPPATNALAKASGTNSSLAAADPAPADGTNTLKSDKKSKEAKPIEVVFVVDGEHAKMVPVKSGISDEDYYEITEGLKEGSEVVSGGFKAISRDLEDGKKIVKGTVSSAAEKKKEP
jgi:HlyD family secretion protein